MVGRSLKGQVDEMEQGSVRDSPWKGVSGGRDKWGG
jgi:hypothetical protein